MPASRLTIAIPTWNRSSALRQTLEGMTRLDVPAGVDWSLLVIDNRSTDATPEVLESFRSRLPLRWVREEVPGAAAARNRGLREIDGDYVLWTDDDVLVSDNWLSSFVEYTSRFPHAAVFGGTIDPWFPVPPDPVLAEAFPLLACGFCATPPGLAAGPCGPEVTVFSANMACNLAAVSGLAFDTRLGPKAGFEGGRDDTDFVNRVRLRGGEVVWCPAMRVKHWVSPERMTLEYLTRLYTDRTRSLVRHSGVQDVPMLFQMPRWALRTMGLYGLKHQFLRLAGARLKSLVALREYSRAKGFVLETRALLRASAQRV